jgi:beta-galactosidase GanA
MRQMKTMNVNSMRVDIIWGLIESQKGIYDFSKYDLLVSLAEKYDIKLFALINAYGIPGWAPGRDLIGQEGDNLDPGWMSVCFYFLN